MNFEFAVKGRNVYSFDSISATSHSTRPSIGKLNYVNLVCNGKHNSVATGTTSNESFPRMHTKPQLFYFKICSVVQNEAPRTRKGLIEIIN